MTLKLLVAAFVVVFAVKLLFFRRMSEMKAWTDRAANAFLIAIGVWMAIHLIGLGL